MNLLNNGFQRQCHRLRHWDMDDSTSNEEGEVDDEDEARREEEEEEGEDDSGDLDDDAEDTQRCENGQRQRAKVGKSGWGQRRARRTKTLLRYAAKFDPLLSLDCAGVERGGAQSNVAIWHPW